MPMKVFGNSSSSYDNGINIKTSSFVQKPYLGTNYIESNMEEDINMKNQYKTKKLPCLQENSYAVWKSYVDSGLNDPSIKRNTTHVDFNHENLDKVRFVTVNGLPAVREHLTPKFYDDEAISHNVDESPMLRLDPDKKN